MSKPIRWTTEEILLQLQQAAAAGVTMNYESLYRHDPRLYNATRKIGGIRKAVELAGLKYQVVPSVDFEKALAPKPEPERQSTIITYPAIDQQFDQRPKERGKLLNRIISPLSMGESQRTQQV